MARTSHEGRAGAPEIALPREHISKLTVIRLNDEFVEGVETAEAWPPKGGLPAGDSRRINVERAFAVSVILHLLIVIALLTIKFPARTAVQDQMDPLGLQS